MILTGDEIYKRVESGDIIIEPFDPDQLGPNSYDVRLGAELAVYDLPKFDGINRVLPTARGPVHLKPYLSPLDTDHPLLRFEMPTGGHVLHPGQFYLAATHERFGSPAFVPMLEGRSSVARLGLFTHVSAGFGDLGYIGQWTLELAPMLPVKVLPGLRIAQVVFHQPVGNTVRQYGGKYQNAVGLAASKLADDSEVRRARAIAASQERLAADTPKP